MSIRLISMKKVILKDPVTYKERYQLEFSVRSLLTGKVTSFVWELDSTPQSEQKSGGTKISFSARLLSSSTSQSE